MVSHSLSERFRDVAFTTAVPFSEDTTDIRYEALAENVSQVYDAGAQLFIPCGNTGEYYSLTDEERIAVVETHVEATGDEATVAAGAAGNVAEITELTTAYEDAGADAIVVMHPNYTYMHESGLADYYHRICDATDLGVVIYKRGPEITRDVLVELIEREEVVAVKYADDDIREFSHTVEDADGDVTWLNGIAERYALSFAIEGAEGYTTGIGNFVPEATLSLFDAIHAEEWERARRLQRMLRPLEDIREKSGDGNEIAAANNVPVVKYGMDLAGYEGGPVREPLVELTDGDAARVEKHYTEIKASVLQ